MYSFAQRNDTVVLDEPFYGNYLSQNPAIALQHPSHQEILATMDCDRDSVIDTIETLATSQHVFIKGMAHHYERSEPSYILDWNNIILIRHPRKLLTSFSKVITNPTIDDIGIKKASELFAYLKEQGKTPLVIDSDELVKNPTSYLQKMCTALEISFSEAMLSWRKGGIPEDGVWAKHWYKNVHNSEGFAVQKTSNQEMPDYLQGVLEEALPFYNILKNSILKND